MTSPGWGLAKSISTRTRTRDEQTSSGSAASACSNAAVAQGPILGDRS